MTDRGANRTADPKFELLRGLKLPVSDYVIFGSVPMYVHGLRQEICDLDIVARRLAWQAVTSLGKPTSAPSGYGNMVELYDGELQFFDQWISSNWNVDELIDESSIVDGLPFAQLNQVFRSKLQMNRLRDQDDLRTLRLYYASH